MSEEGRSSLGGTPICVVVCTAPPDQAELIATSVVSARLAAGVSVIPGVVSVYWWKGAIERAAESTLLINTRVDLVDALTEAIRAAHPYEVPEVVVIPLARGLGNADFHAWVRDETR